MFYIQKTCLLKAKDISFELKSPVFFSQRRILAKIKVSYPNLACLISGYITDSLVNFCKTIPEGLSVLP